MPKFSIIAIILFFSLPALSQNTVTIKGRVLEKETKKPFEAATVYLTSAADSTLIDYSITSKDGSFSLSTRKVQKPVVLKVSFLGYKMYAKQEQSLTADKDFGVIELEESENVLNEVVIKSEAPPIRVKNDTLEFNASSFKVRPDANVETLLKQLPGVEIDADGKITVNGKEVNQILVNGKPFFDKDGKIALQNLPSDIINKVQISDSKTKEEEIAGKKASSNNASINLTIDEEKNKGFFGKAMVGAGTDERYESSLLANYFKGKQKISVLASSNNINSAGFSMNEIFDSMGGGRNTNIWMNDNGGFAINNMQFGGGNGITKSNLVGINYADEFFKDFEYNGSYFFTEAHTRNKNKSKTTYLLPAGSQINESEGSSSTDNYGHNFNMSFEYKIDSTATVYFSPRFVNAGATGTTNSSEFTRDPSDRLLNELSKFNYNNREQNNFASYLYFNKAFKKKGRNLSVSFENENNKSDSDSQVISNTSFYRDNDNDGVTDEIMQDNRNQNTTSNVDRNNYRLRFQYSEPVIDSLAISVSVAYKNNSDKDLSRTFDYNPGTDSYNLFNDILSFDFFSKNTSITPAMGITYEKSKMYLAVEMGPGVTQFNAESLYRAENTRYDNNYIIPWGSANFRYNFTKSKLMSIYYDYEGTLFTARNILAIEDISNPLITVTGNPNLDYTKEHSLYLNFRDYDFATKSGYNFYGGGNAYQDQIVSSTTVDDAGKRIQTYENVSGTFYSWFGANWNKTIKKDEHSLKFGFGMNGNVNKNKGFINGGLYEAMNIRTSPRVYLNYDYGKLFSFAPSYTLTYSDTRYKNYLIDRADNTTHRINVQITSYWPKNVVFGNDFGYTYNSNLAGFNKDFYLWNTSLGYNFFKEKLLAKVKVYDVLNQNQNATRSIGSTYVRDEQNTVLQRYLMFSLTYKLDKFGKKPDEGNRFRMY